jgi:multicomponent Na+:H+ antiporter subunit E
MNNIPHALSLGIAIGVLWLLLSGHYTLTLLLLGVCSVCFVVYIALRMEVVDYEGHPIHLKIKFLVLYWLWLLKAIVLANIDVCKRILDRNMPISPRLIKVRSSQKRDLGRVIYANSITLTPGTISINVDKNIIEVHALTAQSAAELEAGEMDRRITLLGDNI